MIKLDQRGAIQSWLVPFVLTVTALFGALAFGAWAFSGRQDYKNNVDAKIVAAVAASEEQLSEKKAAEFAEKEKSPYRTYTGPAAYGSVGITYPKTWSAYIDETNASGTPLSGYLNPGFVPGIQSDATKSNIALRVEVVSTGYTATIEELSASVDVGKLKVTPYSAPKVSGVIGLRADGEITVGKQGSMVILPLRDKTIKIWTESPQFAGDFDSIILPNFTFVP